MNTFGKNSEDMLIAVVNGDEYGLDSSLSHDRCAQCSFMRNGECVAPAWCRKVEDLFPNAFWRLECHVMQENGTSLLADYVFCMNTPETDRTFSIDGMQCNVKDFDDFKYNKIMTREHHG